jgi:restriction system protein
VVPLGRVTVPTYDNFIEPILRLLAANPDGMPARTVHDAAADALGLGADQRHERLPSGVQAVYKNRAGWAHDRLKRAGYSSSPQRGFWKLTPEGAEFARTNPQLSPDQVASLALLRDEPEEAAESTVVNATAAAPQSPDERLEGALRELGDSVASELLDTVLASSPAFFEGLVLDLLHAIGYGTSRKDLERVGKSGDGGIDGIIALDRLGLEKVYVQAKRWKGAVGRPDVQGFYGALAGQRARKGIFITTSGYTQQAIEFAATVEGLILVDGKRLTELMIEYGVGVSHRTIKVPKLDSDYFDI